jgi:DNA-binding NtrC family response regulator/pSer/pThr/pTyr-binding forkhead associated (FHA) protein
MKAQPVAGDRTRLTGTAPALDRGGPRGPHMVVVEESSSFAFPLPEKGEIVVGRGTEADLQLSAPAASRRHAIITIAGGEVRITDLGSRNGTLVNGERVEGERPLLAGDSVAVGASTMFLFLPPPAQAPGRQVTDVRAFRRRLQDEIERARVFERTVGIVALLLEAGSDQDAVARRVDAELRPVDFAGWLSATELCLVLPEISEQLRAEITSSLLEHMAVLRVTARAGFAAYPHAACDGDALLAAARAAARGGRSGAVADPDADARVEIGDRAIVVADPAMMGLMDLIRRLAPTDLPVLIQGETGAGKENAAQALHHWSPRAKGPFIAVNCAAFTETLVESELFGNEKGAFSGATSARAGLFEAADGGTIFFDEIGDLPRSVQPKLLRVLETKRAMRVGATRERELDVRVVAATNRDLRVEEREGRFRQDLLFRLNAATLVLPPLRNRPREIAVLARMFLADACTRLGLPPKTLSGPSLHLLTAYPWPGNVRELKNVIDYLAATTSGAVIEPAQVRPRLDDLTAAPAVATPAAAAPTPVAEPEESGSRRTQHGYAAEFAPIADELRELEQKRMREALEAAGWVQTRAAELIGMPLRTFQQKAKQFGLTRRRD